MNSVDRWLVAVGAGRWQVTGIKAAQAAGIHVLALDADRNALGFSMADRCAVVDIRNPDAVLQCVDEQGIRPSGAIAFVTEAGMSSAARLREFYDLPGPRQELTRRLTDKSSQRRRWNEAGLPCPQWACARSETEAQVAIANMKGDIIVKPTDSAGSRGVGVVYAGEDWRAPVVSALRESPSGTAIIESFIQGTEFAVETFAHKGVTAILAISEKRKVAGSRDTVAMELGTSALPSDVTDEIGALAVDALASLEHGDGPGHTEILRKDDGSLWLVEAAGRGGGFMVADGIVPRASGFDLACACALQAVGLKPPGTAGLQRNAFVLRFLPSRHGTVKAMSGFDRACALGNVDCGPLVSVGDRVEDAKVDGARLAYILTWAKDRSEAFELADRAESLLKFEIASAPC